MGNIVAIVGRPNVGKSTLFNRLTKTRHAIVDEQSGVTRDRHYGKVDWNGIEFSIIDTGGYVSGSDDMYEGEIRKQARIAMEESDLILFMVDVTAGITGLDQELARILRKSKKQVCLMANKVDTNERINLSHEFYALGMDEPYCISSINGKGTGELLDKVVSSLKEKPEEDQSGLPRITVVGRPNVGKSSLINALVGEDRNIVTPQAGTTRDSINTRYTAFGHDFILVDTAGLRKKAKVSEDVEFYSVMRSVRAIENCDVCLLLIDATEGMNAQDLNIFALAERNRKGIVVLVNKWDLMKKETDSVKEYEAKILKKTAPFTDIPIVFTSVPEKQRLLKALELALKVNENRTRKIKTNKLNNIMLEVIAKYPPPALKGKYIKIKFITQLPTYAPSFAFFCNLPQYVKEPYKRYLENQMRKHFDFNGVPIQIFFRKK
ncbi:MAG TPA: ribosome biogenesis GTPase Der [Flavobacteriales bacterium]|nr:ribosome biogenesis GTPase Der [Flavobacteriales bacterium]